MRDNFSSLSGRSIALRVLPAVVALLMLLVEPPEAPQHRAPTKAQKTHPADRGVLDQIYTKK